MFLPLYQQDHGAVTVLISTSGAGDLGGVMESARREIVDPLVALRQD